MVADLLNGIGGSGLSMDVSEIDRLWEELLIQVFLRRSRRKLTNFISSSLKSLDKIVFYETLPT